MIRPESTRSGHRKFETRRRKADAGAITWSYASQLHVGTVRKNVRYIIYVTKGSLTLANSTISGNHAVYGAGIRSVDADVTVQNSTVAFNTGDFGKNILDGYVAPGLSVASRYRDLAVALQSSILSNNVYGSTENDISSTVKNGYSVTTLGANNLIRIAFSALPSNGLITGTCQLLGSLRSNGGPTQTHALLSHSAAIDTGNNDSILQGTTEPAMFDQRNTPSYLRTSGAPDSPTPKPDMGAYEVQQGDIVFNTGFDGCS